MCVKDSVPFLTHFEHFLLFYLKKKDDYQWLLPKECKNITEWDEGERSSHLQPSKE